MGHYVPLCNYANSMLNDDVLAEDVVQDVFLHLWKNNETLTADSSLQAFLFTSVKNKVYENARSRKAYQLAIDKFKHNNRGSEVEMSAESEDFMTMERLNGLLRHLPPKCKNVFALHKFNGLTYAEIAEKEDISVKTVENHMLKALKILREKYASS